MAFANFKVGDRVEVTSSEHRLRATLFPATVIGRNVKLKNKLTVEYKFLKHKGANNKAVREEVSVFMVRPFPPEQENANFNFGDIVDVFFKGGWWEGTITEVLEDSMFVIYLKFARKEFKFNASQMRHHQEYVWENRDWVPHVDENGEVIRKEARSVKEMLKEKIKAGTLVEVSNDEEGFEGAWFAGTVLKVLGEDKFLVQYKNLKTEDRKGFLKEEIDVNHIRPSLPEHLAIFYAFMVGDKVEGRYNDGWWEGKVTQVLPQSKYKVKYKTEEELDVHKSRLRPHYHWVDAAWVRCWNINYWKEALDKVCRGDDTEFESHVWIK